MSRKFPMSLLAAGAMTQVWGLNLRSCKTNGDQILLSSRLRRVPPRPDLVFRVRCESKDRRAEKWPCEIWAREGRFFSSLLQSECSIIGLELIVDSTESLLGQCHLRISRLAHGRVQREKTNRTQLKGECMNQPACEHRSISGCFLSP